MDPANTDTVPDATAEERLVLKIALAVAAVVLLLIASPAYQDFTARHDHATDRLEIHRAMVLDTNLTSGWNGSTTWYNQEIQLRRYDGTVLTKPMNDIWIDVKEGDWVVAGVSHGRVVTLNGTYVREDSALVGMLLPIASGALVLAALYAALIRRPQLLRRNPLVSAYVTQSLVLGFVLGLVGYGRYEAWRTLIAFGCSIAVPLIVFTVRHLRRATPGTTSLAEPQETSSTPVT